MKKSVLDFGGCVVATMYVLDEPVGNRLEQHLVRITPALAEAWLALNHRANRTPLDSHQQCLASEMISGRWEHTHQGICFSLVDGAVWLVDGQHRLRGIVNSGSTVQIEVNVFVNLGVHSPLDGGKKREGGYVSELGTRKHAIATALDKMQTGSVGAHRLVAPGAVKACYVANRAAIEAVLSAADSAATGSHRLRVAMIAAAAYAYPLGPECVLAFVRAVASGENIRRGEPAFALRLWALPNSLRNDSRGRHNEIEIIRATCTALKAHLEGRTLTSIRATDGAHDWMTQRLAASKKPAVLRRVIGE